MGEIAEMMLDGTLCGSCGEYIGDGDGFSQFCPGCEPDWLIEAVTGVKTEPTKTLKCDYCNRLFASDYARNQHTRAKHGKSPSEREKGE